ncbi:MraY family glycosyltransferase [Cellulomonas fimi]|uniref:Glycosyl transferase, family 4, conserved region n=1 Tax=Cellulomonas fimi (strain ATCC 484 / DSM 20113 / JCM 1341 / CCUG 24087 / LMG 16345 / NBRC 15513 / NCIMB 8980 / NCTC 7547 / NRS-133) TaxID=590998 RepID=F4H7X0_CELFA|nr:MraY family glycosyltransferase [Cellulomonas fimi]AEE46931.1 Glycosyl transferase, family 4, conserved region [Cellulomonas fimi ATCC 484]NNH07878.1 undecaprenyl/decaprenyl-phosphate alpha-N-acetylglucosaminyl 1-phosphate transferase [Cellulomonas fimi]VEH34600.1 Undecaprenyl-phosphate alpha-N-acetylglucosaminyl 1-phosphate transferase [Cellulomonas fimi]
MRVYLLVLLVAAAVTYLMTPLARWCALRWGAITAVRDRDVHAIPTPRLGGLAMYLGILVALLLAGTAPFLDRVYANPRPIIGILGGAALVCALGVADDIWDLDWLTKLLGQVLAAGFLAWQGVQLYQLPVSGVVLGSTRMWMFLTILTVVVAMNAVNFVDGLDGLAAGVLAIGGAAFFFYSYRLVVASSSDDYASLATLVLAALVGACLGFLPHNVYPARIFMGDSGSMVLGFVMSAAAVVVTGQIDPEALPRQQFPAFLPMLLPFAVMLVPLLDMALAVVRRVGAGKSPFHPDRMHLHHRMLALGHSHRRSVGIMYIWTAVFAFGVASLVIWSTTAVLVTVGVGVLVATVLTLGPLRGRATTPPLEAP